jgi:hypothetical protein
VRRERCDQGVRVKLKGGGVVSTCDAADWLLARFREWNSGSGLRPGWRLEPSPKSSCTLMMASKLNIFVIIFNAMIF